MCATREGKSLYWLRKAYKAGSLCAANNIGVIMKNMGKPDKAGEWFEKTIGRGDIEANLNLAKIFLAYNLDICKAEGCLKNVVDSRAVTMGTKEEASYLLDMLDRASEWPKVGVSDKLGISA